MTVAAALVVLDAHLVAAGAALTDKMLDVARGLPTGGRQIRYYWSGEVDPPRMPGNQTLNSQLVGSRFVIAATWPLQDLTPDTVSAIDVEMQELAGQIRTRLDGDTSLGGSVASLDLSYGEPDFVVIANARHVAVLWDLDLSYLEYTLAL